MPRRPLTAKQQDFVRFYADAGSETRNNAYKSAIRAGYSEKSASSGIMDLLGNMCIKQEIAKYKAKIDEKLDLSRKAQHERLMSLFNDPATPASTKVAVLRELNDMKGYHREKAPNEEAEVLRQQRLTAEDKVVAKAVARLRVAEMSGQIRPVGPDKEDVA